MSEYIDREAIKNAMLRYGFKAPDMTVTEFVEDELPTADVETLERTRWIPCSGRLPDMPGDYQVCTKNEYYGTKNVSKRYFNGDYWSGRWTNITHWMPLPEPPEEGDGK